MIQWECHWRPDNRMRGGSCLRGQSWSDPDPRRLGLLESCPQPADKIRDRGDAECTFPLIAEARAVCENVKNGGLRTTT